MPSYLMSTVFNWLKTNRHVTVRNLKTNSDFKDTADVVISARGHLNQIAWPKIDGLGDFGGKLMHSGAWDERCEPPLVPLPSYPLSSCVALN
jgi:cation diffusion facilitator CzcD-associated flavoprotein CzcO